MIALDLPWCLQELEVGDERGGNLKENRGEDSSYFELGSGPQFVLLENHPGNIQ